MTDNNRVSELWLEGFSSRNENTTNYIQVACVRDELCPMRNEHYGNCDVPERAKLALEARRKMYRKMHGEFSVQLISALGMLGDCQNKLVDLVEAVGDEPQTYNYNTNIHNALEAARMMIDQQKAEGI